MDQAFTVVLLAVTSLGAYLIGARRHRLSGRALRVALGHVLEGIGLGLIFFVLNVVVGVTIILVSRHLAGWSGSVYVLNDVMWVAVSGLQGLLFQAWLATRGGIPSQPGPPLRSETARTT